MDLAAAPRLKIVANYAVGYNNIDVDAARQRGIVVTNTPDVLTDATADLTWALILAAAKRLESYTALLRKGGWRDGKGLPQVLKGQRLGLIGFGEIGRMVGTVGKAFGMVRNLRDLTSVVTDVSGLGSDGRWPQAVTG